MPTPGPRFVLLAATLALAGAAPLAAAADCELALVYAEAVVASGQRAAAGRSTVEASDLAGRARLSAIDAAQQAKACNCPEAVPHLAGAARDAARASSAFNLFGAQQYGTNIAKNGQAGVDALRRCAKR